MKSHHPIDEQFKQGLENYSPVPPAQIWERIAQGVAANQKQERRMGAWWWAAATVAILMIAGGGWLLWQTNINTPDHSADTQLFATDKTESYLKENNPSENKTDHTTDKHAFANSSENIAAFDHAGNAPVALAMAAEAKIDAHRSATQPMMMRSMRKTASGNDEQLRMLYPRDAEIKTSHVSMNAESLSLSARKKESQRRLHTQEVLMALAQPTQPTKSPSKERSFVVGGTASPAFSHGSLQNNGTNRSTYNSNEEGIVTMGGGIQVRMETASRWSFESGIAYNKMGQTERSAERPTKFMTVRPAGLADKSPAPHVNSMGTLKVSTITENSTQSTQFISSSYSRVGGFEGDIRQVLDFVEVPLMARYRLIDKQMTISLTGGLSANFLTGNNIFIFESNHKQSIGYTDGIENVSVSSLMGVNLEVPLFRSVLFNLEPRFRYFVTPVNSQTNYHPYSFSMLAGVAVRF